MAFDDRLQYLLLGMGIGFVLGYLVSFVKETKKRLKDIKEELDEVDELVKGNIWRRKRDERGVVRTVFAMRVSLAIVVILTAFAAFQSQKASNDAEKSQAALENATAQIKHVTECNKTVLRQALVALDERTTYSEAQINANIGLQTSFSELLSILLHQPPFSEHKRSKATEQYFQDLTNFISIADKTKSKVRENPFPTSEQLDACLQR